MRDQQYLQIFLKRQFINCITFSSINVRLTTSLQVPTTLTIHHRRKKMTTWCCQVVHTSTTGRRHQTCLHSQMTPPASPTLTFPTNTLWKTSTWASLALYSSVSLVRNRLSPFSPSPCPCTFVFVSLKLAMFCSLKRQSR